jgi:SGNH hydrolase-like domain, acetyltransferase AlgX
MKMRTKFPSNIRLLAFGAVVILCLAVTWLLFLFFGRQLINWVCHRDSNAIVQYLMPGRASTPIEDYYQRAGQFLIVLTSWSIAALIALAILTFLVRQPAGALTVFCSFFISSLALFALFELFPSLIIRFGLDRIDYYAWKNCCIPDPTLLYRYRPMMDQTIPFQGYLYSPLYGVDVPVMTVHLTTNVEGFMNTETAPKFPHIAVIGDSFIADALDEPDTFSRRLEADSGWKVSNLAVAGYGPFQYLEILKRYGIQLKPRYVLFVLYAGNDVEDLRSYLRLEGSEGYYFARLLAKPFPLRYMAAVVGFGRFFRRMGYTAESMLLRRWSESYGHTEKVHPDIAVVRLGSHTYKMLLTAENKEASTATLANSQEWQALKQILTEFKDLCIENNIVPLTMYIPTAVSILAEHSTDESGKNWLALRDTQIARKRVTEEAFIALTRELKIQLVDLTPSFEAAANSGQLIYYTFDTHWNSAGREVAAAYVAQELKTKLLNQAGPQEQSNIK